MNVPNTVVQGLLGRLPPGGLATGTTTVALLDDSQRLYADTRRNQIDMRFAKVFRFGGASCRRRRGPPEPAEHELRDRLRVAVFLHRRERRDVEQPDHDPRAPVHAVQFHAELLTRTRGKTERPVPRMGRAFPLAIHGRDRLVLVR